MWILSRKLWKAAWKVEYKETMNIDIKQWETDDVCRTRRRSKYREARGCKIFQWQSQKKNTFQDDFYSSSMNSSAVC